MLSFGAIINGGFRHLRERPLSVLTWSALYGVPTIAYSVLVMRPAMSTRLAEIGNGTASSTALFGTLLPSYAMLCALIVILFGAALRTILRRDEGGFAGLRFGMDELRLLGLFLLLGIGGFVLLFVGSLVAGALGGVIALVVGRSAIGLLVAAVPALLFFGALMILEIRLSLVAALTILRRKIVIGESWTLTRGHFWRLFGAYLVLGIMLGVAYLALIALTAGPYFSAIAQGHFTPQAIQAAGQAQLAGGVTVTLVIGWVANALLAGVSFAMWSGAAATATQALLGTSEVDLADTFA